MSNDQFTSPPSNETYTSDPALLDAAIQDILGLGLPYSAWRGEVERRNHVWYPNLEKVIIQKEYEFFKDEIQHLRLEPNIVQSSRVKSNSLKSILKRLKGELWMDGCPNEWEIRLHSRRLLSESAKDRTLINYVQRWDREAALLLSQTPAQSNASTPNIDSTEDDSSISVDSTIESSISSYNTNAADTSRHDAPGQELVPNSPSHATDMNTDKTHSAHDDASRYQDANETSFSFSDPRWSDDFNLLPEFQNAVSFTSPENSDPFHTSETSTGTLQPTPSHDAVMAAFDALQYGHNDIPSGAVDYNQGIGSTEVEPNAIAWMDANPVSEESWGSPETTSSFSDNNASSRTFRDASETINSRDLVVADQTINSSEHSTELPNITQGPEISSESASFPQATHNVRKRRRQNTFGMSPDTSKHIDIADKSSANNLSLDDDTTMSNCESSSPFSNNQAWHEQSLPAPPSRPLPMLPCFETKPRVAKVCNDRQPVKTDLTSRLLVELEKEKEDHQKTKEEFEGLSRKYGAVEAELHDLREQVRRLQLSNERTIQQYDELARDLINEKIIHQSSTRKKSVSDIVSIGTGEDREHNQKVVHGFRNPRPLSMMHVAANMGVATPQSCSPTSSDNPAILRIPLPIATGRGSRAGSTASLAIRTITSNGTSTVQCSSPVSSENSAATFTRSRPTGRSNRSGSADSLAAPNINPTGRSSRSGSTDSLTAPSFNNIVRKEPGPIQYWLMHKLSNGLLSKRQREDKNHSTLPTPSPSLSILPDSVLRELSETHRDGDKRLTNDSGYASLEFDTTPRASVADAE